MMNNTFKGEIKKGTVRKTNNQFKKFVTQFQGMTSKNA